VKEEVGVARSQRLEGGVPHNGRASGSKNVTGRLYRHEGGRRIGIDVGERWVAVAPGVVVLGTLVAAGDASGVGSTKLIGKSVEASKDHDGSAVVAGSQHR
jgi:hypothetical protein